MVSSLTANVDGPLLPTDPRFDGIATDGKGFDIHTTFVHTSPRVTSDGPLLDGARAFAYAAGSDATGWDLRPTSGSVHVDAGAASFDDPDGSRADAGAYGGPDAWD